MCKIKFSLILSQTLSWYITGSVYIGKKSFYTMKPFLVQNKEKAISQMLVKNLQSNIFLLATIVCSSL